MLDGKVIAITGAGSGIGQAAALLCAETGARILAGDVSEAGLQRTRAAVAAKGGQIETMVVDVGDEAQVIAFVDEARKKFGRLDGAFNNAGLQMQNKLLQDLTLEEWNRVNRVNATGVFLCMKYEIVLMRETGGGAIVNTASGNGMVAQPYSSEYVASKHAVVGLTRAASTEASITGVRVNAVLPGMIETPMIEDLVKSEAFQSHYQSALERHTIGRFGKADEVAYVARFLLSDQSAFMNGAAVAVDGGYTAR